MPTIVDFGAYRIRMYFRDHNPPHFHVYGDDFAARLRIDDLTVIAGDAPAAVLRRVRRWAEENRPMLLGKWNEYSG